MLVGALTRAFVAVKERRVDAILAAYLPRSAAVESGLDRLLDEFEARLSDLDRNRRLYGALFASGRLDPSAIRAFFEQARARFEAAAATDGAVIEGHARASEALSLDEADHVILSDHIRATLREANEARRCALSRRDRLITAMEEADRALAGFDAR